MDTQAFELRIKRRYNTSRDTLEKLIRDFTREWFGVGGNGEKPVTGVEVAEHLGELWVQCSGIEGWTGLPSHLPLVVFDPTVVNADWLWVEAYPLQVETLPEGRAVDGVVQLFFNALIQHLDECLGVGKQKGYGEAKAEKQAGDATPGALLPDGREAEMRLKPSPFEVKERNKPKREKAKIYVPKDPRALDRWKCAWKIIREMRKKYRDRYDDLESDNPNPTYAEMAGGILDKKGGRKLSEKTIQRIVKAGEAKLLK